MTHAFFRHSLAVATLATVISGTTVISGCGGGPRGPVTAPVAGTVTYQGKPIPKLSVAFLPDKGMVATGTTDEQGQFTLMTSKPGDGAMPGSYRVSIKAVPDTTPPMPGFPGAEQPDPASPIPAKYGDPATSGLSGNVDASRKNDFKFDLTD